MLIKIWSLAIASLFLSPVPTADFRSLAAKDLTYSVLLHMKGTQTRPDGKEVKIYGGCSGTYIAPTEILTAAHCFTGYAATNVWARGQNDLLGYPVHLIKIDIPKDLAVVETVYPHSYARLGDGARIGDDVLNIGSPYNFEFVASQGIVATTGFHVNGFSGTYIVTTAMINPGSSGGGAFNKKGQLIGVNTLSVGMFGWTGISMAVDVKTIKEFL